jgi:hypothetical protein
MEAVHGAATVGEEVAVKSSEEDGAMQWRVVDAVQWRRRCFPLLAALLSYDRD